MPHKRDDNLFKDTTMTFGEHLEELRVSLVRALVCLVAGVIIGLLVGDDLVYFIEQPLKRALSVFYQERAVEDYEKWAKEQVDRGKTPFYSAEEINRLVNKERLVFEIRYFHPRQVWGALGQAEPKAVEGLELPPPEPDPPAEPDRARPRAVAAVDVVETARGELSAKGRLVPVFLWNSIEDDPRINPSAFSAQEGFSLWMKASLVVGVVLASPGMFYFLWMFVAAGLYRHEKKYVYTFLPFSLGLFAAGVATAFLFVFDPVLNFLFSFNSWLGLDPDPRISEWLSFVLFLPLGFGISFQLPLVMLFLERIGIFDLKTYLDKLRIAILVIFILSAILTPADPYSIFLMAVPLTVLYFVGILLCRFMPRSRQAPSELD